MRLQALDLLRFIAALAVVAYHYLGTSNPSYPQLAGIAQFGDLVVILKKWDALLARATPATSSPVYAYILFGKRNTQ
jgi:peptidoglycan/LPS O-acetylase OafA/YrhL